MSFGSVNGQTGGTGFSLVDKHTLFSLNKGQSSSLFTSAFNIKNYSSVMVQVLIRDVENEQQVIGDKLICFPVDDVAINNPDGVTYQIKLISGSIIEVYIEISTSNPNGTIRLFSNASESQIGVEVFTYGIPKSA